MWIRGLVALTSFNKAVEQGESCYEVVLYHIIIESDSRSYDTPSPCLVPQDLDLKSGLSPRSGFSV